MSGYLVTDPECQMPPEEFSGLTEALACAEMCIQGHLQDGQWVDGAGLVTISQNGVVTHKSIMREVPAPDYIQEQLDSDPDYRAPFDFYCEFTMQPFDRMSAPAESPLIPAALDNEKSTAAVDRADPAERAADERAFRAGEARPG